MSNIFSQMERNTVKSDNQLKASKYVTLENPEGKGIRIMFVGNSITLHGVKEDIGWYVEWGMAASSKENDYVHRLISSVNEVSDDAAFCISQVALWETNYKNGSETHSFFEAEREFKADIIVMRFIENCKASEFDKDVYKKELDSLLKFLDGKGDAKVIFTTGFWKHPGDEITAEYAKENGYPLVYLGDLGEKDEMKAIGLFEHAGVANHPGDLGMKMIAERIFEVIKKLV